MVHDSLVSLDKDVPNGKTEHNLQCYSTGGEKDYL